MSGKRLFDIEIYLATDGGINFGIPNTYFHQGEVTVGRAALMIEPDFDRGSSRISLKPFSHSYKGNPGKDLTNLVFSIVCKKGGKCGFSESGDTATIYSVIKDYDLPQIAAEMGSVTNAGRKTSESPVYGLNFREVPEDILRKASIPDAEMLSDIFITDQDGKGYDLKGGILSELPDSADELS